jgi:uncharacterized protein YqjF (DUF2071 family)
VSISAQPADTPIDRLGPAQRPPGAVLMYQRWSHLLFLHWPVAAQVIAPHLPRGLELDTFDGRAYVGLIPFTMSNIRARWLPPLPGLSRFHEVNLRTYVHFSGRDPGVWFFSLDAANRIAVSLARLAFHLPYFRAWIRLQEERRADEPELEIVYDSVRKGKGTRPASCALRYQPSGQPAPALPGSLDHFLVERYILYSHARGRLYRGRVHHTPYPLQTADVQSLEENFLVSAGLSPEAIVPLVHYASAVDVEIFPLEPAGNVA